MTTIKLVLLVYNRIHTGPAFDKLHNLITIVIVIVAFPSLQKLGLSFTCPTLNIFCTKISGLGMQSTTYYNVFLIYDNVLFKITFGSL